MHTSSCLPILTMRGLFIAILLAVSTPAQVDRPTSRPLRYADEQAESRLAHRALDTDEAGARVWSVYAPADCDRCNATEKTACRACDGGKHALAKHCAECRGKGEVSCPQCLGRGELRDPFDMMPCPRCEARERYTCGICFGLGRRKIIDGGMPQCVGCAGKGGLKCDLCKGKREIPVIRASARSLEVASLEQLDDAAAEIAELLVDVESAIRRLSSPAGGLGREMNAKVPFDAVAKRAEEIHKLWRGCRRRVETTAKVLLKTRGERLWGGRSQRTILREYHDAACALGAWLSYQQKAIERCRARFVR